MFAYALGLANTILAGNRTSDCGGPLASLGHNLPGKSTGCTFTTATGDQVGGCRRDNPGKST